MKNVNPTLSGALNMATTRQEYHKRISHILLYAIVFALPVYGRLLPFLIALLLINWLAERNYRHTFRLIFTEKPRRFLVSFSSLYFLYLAGLLHTSNFQYAAEDLVIKLSLLLFPLMFATSDVPLLSRMALRRLFAFFLAGCGAGSLLLLGRAFYYTFILNQPGAFYYSSLSWSFHPGYYAMYLALAISIVLHSILFRKGPSSRHLFAAKLLILLFFTTMIVLLSSKAGLLVWLAVAGLYVFILAVKQQRYADAVKLAVSAVFVFTFVLFIFPNALTRVSQATQALGNKGKTENTGQSTSERIAIWKSSEEIIRNNFLFGTGTGDVKDALLEQYRTNDLENLLNSKLNAHNQYIQTFITLGVVGILLLLALFTVPAVAAFRQGSYLYFTFLFIAGISMVFESMFETQAGVVFYALFNALLFSCSQPDSADDPLQVAVRQV